MINTSNEYKQVVRGDNRVFYANAKIILTDGTELNPNNNTTKTLKALKVDDATNQSGQFAIGTVIANKLILSLNNIDDAFSDYDFTGATIRPSIGLQLSQSVETLKKGVFTSEHPKTLGPVITLTALDNMAKFDKPFKGVVAAFPITIGSLLGFVCAHCGVMLATTAFPNSNYIIQSRPDDDAISCREVVSWIAQIAGCFARCNVDGALEIKWYDTEVFEQTSHVDGGVFDVDTPYSSGDNVDGGNFTDYSSGDNVDGGTFVDQKRYHHIYTHYSNPTISVDDVVITGIKVTSISEEPFTALYGQEGYILPIEGNQFIQGQSDAEQVANFVGAKIVGMRFRPLTATVKSDPSIEAGDVAYVSTRKGNSYQTVITSTAFGVHQQQRVSCEAESPLRNSATRYSAEAKAVIEARKNTERKLSAYDLMVKQLNDLVAHSFGVYKTEEVLPDGSVVYYMHDKPTKAESMKIWKQTADAFAVSTDGGNTYTAGFDVNGNAVVNILSAIGINAEWITLGKLYSKDGGTLIDLDYGVANSDNLSFNDNIQDGFPLTMPFNIDDSVSKINKVLLKYSQKKFRTYSTTAVSGGGSSVTSASGGGTTGTTGTGGGMLTNTSQEPAQNLSVSVAVSGSTSSVLPPSNQPHSHTFSGSGSGGAALPAHIHTVGLSDHSHSVALPNHTHGVSIPDHSHTLNFGIKETDITDNEIKVYVDNVLRATVSDLQGIINLTAWVTNTGWHEIEIRSTALKKISAQLNIKSYIKS